MAANLVSLVMQFITPSMVSKMASTLGLDRDDAQKAIGVSIPAILASFASVASKADGGQQLSNALAQQSGALDQIRNAIGSGGEKAVAESGTNFLSSLLGDGALTSVANAVGRFTGIDSGIAKSLLSFLGPIVGTVIGQQQRSAGLDAKGLTSLLASQKDQIAAAMPAGFANLLGGTGILDGLGGSWRSGASAASAAASSATDRVSDISSYTTAHAGELAQAARTKTSSVLPYWASGLAAVALLGWFLGTGDNRTVVERPMAAVTGLSETTGAAPPDSGLTNLATELTSSVDTLRSTLLDITDPASARAALPKLQQATAQLDSINTAASQLPPDARRGISSLVESSMPMLNQLCDRVMSKPQTAQLAKPAIDALRSRLEALARS